MIPNDIIISTIQTDHDRDLARIAKAERCAAIIFYALVVALCARVLA